MSGAGLLLLAAGVAFAGRPVDIDWVRVPGGTLHMGPRSLVAAPSPADAITLRDFELSRTEVTVAQYRKCVKAGVCEAPPSRAGCRWGERGFDDRPVGCVMWTQAAAFAAWVGGRLPSEAEWEYAARNGSAATTWPWGEEPLSCERAFIKDCEIAGPAPGCSRPGGSTTLGICDMVGNVEEWTADAFREDRSAIPRDGRPAEGDPGLRTMRGGAYHGNNPRFLRPTFREGRYAVLQGRAIGFRVARDVPGATPPPL